MNKVFADLPVTIFEAMSQLARDNNAINLGQGFPDDPGPEDIRRGAANVLRPGIVRKTLAEIDRVVVARGLRHRLEDRDGQIRENLVHGRRIFGSHVCRSHEKVQPPVLVGNPAAFQASMPPAKCLS